MATVLPLEPSGTQHEAQGQLLGVNAVVESFFGSLKKERIKKQIYKNRSLAEADVRDYIEAFYNPSRRHSHLDGVSPDQFEAAHRRSKRGVH